MLIMQLFKNKKKQNNFPGKNQPDIFLGAASPKDLIAPSIIKEVDPSHGDYYVEVGSTVESVRYFRSFFAALTGNSTFYGMMNSLYAGDFGEADCDTAIHLIPLDPARTLWQLEQRIAQLEVDYEEENNAARRKTILNRINDLTRRHQAIMQSMERLFMVSIQTTASATDLEVFKRFCNLLVKKFGSKGIQLRAADTRQLQALFGMTPLDKEIIKEPFRDMESSNIADLFPFGQGGLRHKSGIIIGHDVQGDLIFYNCWEPSLGNYNIVIFGRSGFGKSFLVKLITERSTFIGIVTAIIDPEDEYENLMVGMGCPYIKLHPNSKYRINIFDVDEEEDENGNVFVNLESTIKAAQAVVFKMIRTYEPNALTGQVKIAIQELIKELYEERGINENPMSLYQTETRGNIISVAEVKKKMPTLSDLYIKMTQKPDLQQAAMFLKPFTRHGSTPAQAIFDCQSNVTIKDVPAFAISTKELDEDIMKPIGLFIATKWVWEKFGKNRRLKKRIVVDEAQKMMDDSSIELAKWLEDAYRTARKRNISMCAVTQGFEVFLKLPQGMGILKNASTKILMRQESIDIEAVQDKFSLSEGESAFLLNAPKGWGIIKVNNDASIFFADTTETEYRMFTSDPNDLGGVIS
jgi:type IV secretory pathway VirB4 component